MFERNTKATTVRVPKSLAKEVDDEITRTRAYSNRQSYTEYAIRQYIEIMDRMILNQLETPNDEGPVGKYTILKGILNFHVRAGENRYEKYKGAPESIIIRLPIGLIERIELFCLYFSNHLNVQNFIRIAMAAAIELEDPHEAVMKKFHELEGAITPEMIAGYDKTSFDKAMEDYFKNIALK